MKNNVLIVGLLTLIAGLLIGYNVAPRQMMSEDDMSEVRNEMKEMMDHEEELISGNGAMQHSMEEMTRGLKGKTGEEFEKAFLEMMIVHHIGAIEMAEQLLEQTDRPELVQMGNDIITVQQQEVEMMKTWLSKWFNS